jgi:murein DD-endopeptidase MepM/ murein hydrolase activator NlpD
MLMQIPRRSVIGRLAVVLLLGGVALLGGCATSESCETAPTRKDAIQRGRHYTTWLYAQDLEKLRPHVARVFREDLGGLSGLDAEVAGGVSALGAESALISERVLVLSDDTFLYQRTASFADAPLPVSIEWAMRGRDLEIWNLTVRTLSPEAPSRYTDYRSQAGLRLPFRGEWVVLWGGRTTQDNYHADTIDQRFASDLVVFEDGYFFSGDGSRNEDHYCFGKPILAPADGTVVEAERSVPDNSPGGENLEQPLGNHVILDHGNGEFSFLCHFKQGTTTVRAGERVRQGQRLGECGNSGGSDVPHLHYHLQNTPTPFAGEGLPVQFRGYRVNGALVARGELTRGQSLRPAE